MSEQKDQKNQAEDKKIIFPDYIELWKEMYFKTEKAFAESFNEYVSTEAFSQLQNKTLEQQLSLEKVTRKNAEKLLENSAFPLKKDIARIAELVISVEEKVDTLDYQLVANISNMADNLLIIATTLEENIAGSALIKSLDDKLVSLQKSLENNKDEMLALRKEMTMLGRKVDKINKSAAPAKEKVSKSKNLVSKEEL